MEDDDEDDNEDDNRRPNRDDSTSSAMMDLIVKSMSALMLLIRLTVFFLLLSIHGHSIVVYDLSFTFSFSYYICSTIVVRIVVLLHSFVLLHCNVVIQSYSNPFWPTFVPFQFVLDGNDSTSRTKLSLFSLSLFFCGCIMQIGNKCSTSIVSQ